MAEQYNTDLARSPSPPLLFLFYIEMKLCLQFLMKKCFHKFSLPYYIL